MSEYKSLDAYDGSVSLEKHLEAIKFDPVEFRVWARDNPDDFARLKEVEREHQGERPRSRRDVFLEVLFRELSHRLAAEEAGLSLEEVLDFLNTDKKFLKRYERLIEHDPDARVVNLLSLDTLLKEMKDGDRNAAQALLKAQDERFRTKKKQVETQQRGLSASAAAEKRAQKMYESLLPN